jgi:hypothetical protein
MRPTEEAERSFTYATNKFASIPSQGDVHAQNNALNNLANGLLHMNRGLRATYMLLEEVKTLLERQALQRPGR